MRKDIDAFEREHEKHLSRPDANPFDFCQLGDDLVIGKSADFFKLHFAGGDLGGEVEKVACFLG